MKKYNQIYGKFSQGTGSWLDLRNFKDLKKNFLNKNIKESYQAQILQDLLRMGISKNIKKMNVLDIGSGRQAIAFEKLKAKKIDLIDISDFNINRFKKFRKKNKSKITPYQMDICSDKFNNFDKKYDLIYLHGIIQHTENPVKAIRNLVAKLKPNGIMWFYFYQMGASKNLYLQLLRNIYYNSNVSQTEILNFNPKNLNEIQIDGLLDDLLADYVHILPSSFYIKVFTSLGLSTVYSKDIYDDLPSLRISTPSCLISLQRKSKLKSFNLKSFIKKQSEMSIFDKSNYNSEDKNLISKLKKINDKIIKCTKNKKNNKKIIKSLLFIKKQMDLDYFLMPYSLKKQSLVDTFRVVFNEINTA
ncbi:class I SAM-dependent methyltransferase [Candidatus Pelagibacter sp.]|nr:class I SAM-dependent methyltransferase [Candidatus Pelagibacter sp.]